MPPVDLCQFYFTDIGPPPISSSSIRYFFFFDSLVVENVRFLFLKLINYKFIIISIINLLSIILDDRSIISLRGIDPCYSSVTKIVLTYTNILAFDLEIYFNFYPRKIKRVFLYDF